MAAAESPLIEVELVWSPARADVRRAALKLSDGATVEQALAACEAFIASMPGATLQGLHIGVWGRVVPLDHALRARDRIEVYRALTVDPKEARRQRFRASGKRIVSRHRPRTAGEAGG